MGRCSTRPPRPERRFAITETSTGTASGSPSSCARLGVLPWRFDASHYQAGLAHHREQTGKLDGRPAAGGDGALVAAMREAGRELHEEALLEELLSDLRAESGSDRFAPLGSDVS